MLKRTPTLVHITLDDFDPSSEWVVESQAPTFEIEDLSWLDLDPLPEVLPSGQGNLVGLKIPFRWRIMRMRMRVTMRMTMIRT